MIGNHVLRVHILAIRPRIQQPTVLPSAQRPTLPEHHIQSSYPDEIAQRLFPQLQFPFFLHLFPPFIALAWRRFLHFS